MMRIFRFFLLIAAVLGASGLFAADDLRAKLRAEPAEPYVGEDFSLLLEITTPEGGEVEVAGLRGLPPPSLLTVGQFVDNGVREERGTDGTTVLVHTLTADARPVKAFSFQPDVIAHLRITERKSNGFFTSWNTQTRSVRVSSGPFSVKELPEEGRPADFSGAVGRFSLRLEATPTEVMPQDIVELRLSLSGTGYLGEAKPALPSLPSDLFKTYPPVVTQEPGKNRMVLTQSVIPLSTNAVEIGSVSMAFFDAKTGIYTNALTAPVRLVFREREKKSEPEVREVVVGTGSWQNTDDGVDVSKYFQLPRGKNAVELKEPAVIRVAPGATAKAIVTLPAGTPVIPLETERGWIRVKTKGHSGWLPAQDME